MGLGLGLGEGLGESISSDVRELCAVYLLEAPRGEHWENAKNGGAALGTRAAGVP